MDRDKSGVAITRTPDLGRIVRLLLMREPTVGAGTGQPATRSGSTTEAVASRHEAEDLTSPVTGKEPVLRVL